MEFVGEEIPYGFRAVFVLIASLEIVVGVIGNSSMLSLLLTRLVGKQGHHNLFIANLALADILLLIYWLPFFVLDMILGHHPVANQAHCQANGFILCFCFTASLLSLVSISLNRYLHVCHSRLYHQVFNRTTTIVWCLLLWLPGALLSVPPLFGVGSYEYNKLNHVCSFTDTYPKAMAVIIAFGSTLAIGYFNLAMFSLWKRTAHNHNSQWGYVPSLRNSRRKCLRLCPCGNRRKGDNCVMKTNEENGDCAKSQTDEEVRVRYSRGSVLARETSLGGAESEKTRDAPVRPPSAVSVLSAKQMHLLASSLLASSEETHQSSENTHLCEWFELAETSNTQTTQSAPANKLSVEDSDRVTDEDTEEHITLDQEEAFGLYRLTLDEVQDTAAKGTLGRMATAGILSDTTESILPASATEGKLPETATAGTLIATANEDTLVAAVKEDTLPDTAKAGTLLDAATDATLSRKPEQPMVRQRNFHPCYWQQTARRRRKQQDRERAFVRSIVVVSLLMVLSFLPYGAFKLLEGFLPKSAKGVIYMFVLLLLFVNCSVNWIVYGVMNQSFRREYAKTKESMVGLCFPCKNVEMIPKPE